MKSGILSGISILFCNLYLELFTALQRCPSLFELMGCTHILAYFCRFHLHDHRVSAKSNRLRSWDLKNDSSRSWSSLHHLSVLLVVDVPYCTVSSSAISPWFLLKKAYANTPVSVPVSRRITKGIFFVSKI